VGLARFASMLSAKSTQFCIDRISGILLLHFIQDRQTAKTATCSFNGNFTPLEIKTTSGGLSGK